MLETANRGFQRGAFAGWNEYRHGHRRPVTLAGGGVKTSPLVTGEKRKHIVGQVMDLMRDWRHSPFEDEGGMIAALRSAWCLKGYEWRRSDNQAHDIVAEALRLMGAKRPSWEQGQRWYAEQRDNCIICGCQIEDAPSTKAAQFCSEVCARVALETRDFRRRSEEDKLYAAAARIVKKGRTAPRNCQWCGSSFHPVRERSGQACCSFSCASKLRHQRSPALARSCECSYCGNEFIARSVKALHCSKACGVAASRERAGSFPRELRPHVFDRYFTTPINRSPRPITSQAFDWMMLEAGVTITLEVAA